MKAHFKKLRFGFTLVEMVVAMSIAVIVIVGVLAVFIMSARGVTKTMHADDAIRSTRKFQDHLSREISSAAAGPVINNVAQSPIQFRNSGVDADGVTRSSQIIYRVNIGTALSHIQGGGSDLPLAATTVTIDWPSNSTDQPKQGDYLRMDSPDLGAGVGIQISAPPVAVGSTGWTLTLATPFSAAIADTTYTSVPDQSIVYIQRERSYQTIPDPLNPTTAPAQLVWFESTANPTQTVISSNIDPANLYLFESKSQTSGGVTYDHQLGWIYSYISGDAGMLASLTGLGRYSYVTNNDSQGAMIARSDALGSLGNVTTTLGGDVTLSTTPSTTVPTTTISTKPTTTISTVTTMSISTVPTTTISTKATTTLSTVTTATSSAATTSIATTKNTSTSVKTTVTTKPTTTKTSTTTSTSKTTTSNPSTSTSTVPTTTVSTKPTTTISTVTTISTSTTTILTTSTKTTTSISTTTTSKATTTIFDG